MSLKLHRPTPDGLEPSPVETDTRDWRLQLRSRRWQPAKLENPEIPGTSPLLAVLFFVGLGALTFVALLIGYGSGFWG